MLHQRQQQRRRLGPTSRAAMTAADAAPTAPPAAAAAAGATLRYSTCGSGSRVGSGTPAARRLSLTSAASPTITTACIGDIGAPARSSAERKLRSLFRDRQVEGSRVKGCEPCEVKGTILKNSHWSLVTATAMQAQKVEGLHGSCTAALQGSSH
eukprot:354717-Chlamydomonas_euryale.AAC.1